MVGKGPGAIQQKRRTSEVVALGHPICLPVVDCKTSLEISQSFACFTDTPHIFKRNEFLAKKNYHQSRDPQGKVKLSFINTEGSLPYTLITKFYTFKLSFHAGVYVTYTTLKWRREYANFTVINCQNCCCPYQSNHWNLWEENLGTRVNSEICDNYT